MNSFADRDIFMRFLGGGIGHSYMRELERELPGFLPGVDFTTGEFNLAIPDDQPDVHTTEPLASPADTCAHTANDAEDGSGGIGNEDRGEDGNADNKDRGKDGEADNNKGEGDGSDEGEDSGNDERDEGDWYDEEDENDEDGEGDDNSDEGNEGDSDDSEQFETLEGELGFGTL